MADIEKLSQMVDAIINDKSDEDQKVLWHGYAKSKMQDILHPEADSSDDEGTQTDKD